MFGGGRDTKKFREKKIVGGTPSQQEPDALVLQQQSGKNFDPNPMLSSFSIDFALKFGDEGLKIQKKRSSSQNLRLLDHAHLICLAVSQKSVCGDLFLGKSLLVLLCQYKSLLSLEGAQAVIWRAQPQNAPRGAVPGKG